METILEIRKVLLILIPSGVAMRIILCLIYSAANPDDASSYKKKILHALIFMVIAETIAALSNTIIGYFPPISWS